MGKASQQCNTRAGKPVYRGMLADNGWGLASMVRCYGSGVASYNLASAAQVPTVIITMLSVSVDEANTTVILGIDETFQEVAIAGYSLPSESDATYAAQIGAAGNNVRSPPTRRFGRWL